MGTDEHHVAQSTAVRPAMTTAKIARLERLFEAARQKSSGLNPNYDYASELYAQCVVGNPGSDVYVKAFIENLQKKYDNNHTGAPLAHFKERASRNAMKKGLADQQWDEVVKHGVKVLAVNPWDVSALTAMAQAAKKSGDWECEMYYLKTALSVNPKDAAVNRLCAVAAADRQLLDQAIHCWHRVEEAYPDDEEAKRAISMLQTQRMAQGGFTVEGAMDKTAHAVHPSAVHYAEPLTVEKKLLSQIAKEPKQLSPYIELSQYYFNEDRFDKAEEILAQAFEMSNGDADVREKWEDAQLRSFRHKIITTADPQKKNKLQQEYYHKELEFYKKRCERYPGNLFFRYDLGLRYLVTKQYHEAIRELQLSKNDPRRKGVSFLALGKCFQQINQYRLALSHYQTAVEEISERDIDNKKESLRLAGKLALAMGELDAADKHLSVLAAMDFSYKDVSALLDKLAETRKNQLSEGKKAKPDHPPEISPPNEGRDES
jgi:tetratricopeptide (TPR) repeat protein